MNDHTLSISIGRNVGDKPMSEADWEAFLHAVIVDVSVTSLIGSPDSIHYGTGTWDGFREESAILSWFSIDTGDVNLENMLARLTVTADTFGQDAIAVSLNRPIFAGIVGLED